MDNGFITGLARAGTCHNHRKPAIPSLLNRSWRRSIHTKPTRPIQEPAAATAISREDLHDLVDIYGTREEETFNPWEEEAPLKDNVGIGPEALDLAIGPEVLEKSWDDAYFTNNGYLSYAAPSVDVPQILNSIDHLLTDPDAPHEDLYTLYRKLPDERVSYIPHETLFPLLRHLSRVPASRFQKSYADNFLAILYDMRAASMPINIHLWTTAIRFSGLAEGPRQAVRLWREMEQHYDIVANNYTFSVLFDLTIKSGNFALAEMIEKEARERHIPLDRISRMSRIFYYGLLGDGAGVRRSYAAFVDAGEIVDTAVLTNVISALIDAGEYPAAVETFERMKTLHKEKQGATQAPHEWRQRRELRGLLRDAAHHYRDRPGDRQKFQDAAPVNPDWRTYRAFLTHHSRTTADWPAIESLLTEMKKEGIPLNREIYRVLFQGFAKHGGIQVVSWNGRNLEMVWKSFERSCQKRPQEFAYDASLVIAIVKGFAFVVSKPRARVVWEVLRGMWTVEESVKVYVERLLGRTKVWHGG